MNSVHEDLKPVSGIKFVDHVAIAVKQGDLDGQVKAYEMLGFNEVHREEVLGSDQVREVLRVKHYAIRTGRLKFRV